MQRLVFTVIIAALAVGCSSTQPQPDETSPAGAVEPPAWVARGAAAFPNDAGKTFFGVGVAEAKVFSGEYLQRTAAAERARAGIAGQLRTMAAFVFKAYAEAAMTPGMDPREMAGLAASVQRNVVDAAMPDAETRGAWVDPVTGDTYELAAVSFDSAARALRSALIAMEKDRLRVDVPAAHKELDSLIEKYHATMK